MCMTRCKANILMGLTISLWVLVGGRLSAQGEATPPGIYPEEHFTQSTVALKTNLLGELALLPNIGIEVPLGDKWSLQGTYFHIWLSHDPSHKYWRVQGGDLEGRYWLKEALLGHHFGIYAQLFTYDFELGRDGVLGRKPHVGAGFSYGWAYPVANRWSLDFSIGVGYLTGEYETYTPCNGCYLWQHTKRLQYFGPTKAAISLVYHIQ